MAEEQCQVEQQEQEIKQPISNLVNQQFNQQLQELGYSKNVSEKSLLHTNNASVEAAVQWIMDHQNDEDFEEELFMVGSQPSEPTGPKLSKEEAALKARELQQKIREERERREKKDAEERERQRVISGKQMAEARRELEVAEQKRAIEMKMRQKREDEIAKQKMLEQLEKDRQERFGKKAGQQASTAQQQKTPLELAKLAIQQIKTAYPSNLFLDKAKVCYSTLQIFIRNVLKNPSEEKYRRINLLNQNFQNRVGELLGGIAVLKNAGFQEQDTFLVLNEPNIKLLEQIETALITEINSN